jgi:hypothetical protein
MSPGAGVPANSCDGAARANDTDNTRNNAIVHIGLFFGNLNASMAAVFKL